MNSKKRYYNQETSPYQKYVADMALTNFHPRSSNVQLLPTEQRAQSGEQEPQRLCPVPLLLGEMCRG